MKNIERETSYFMRNKRKPILIAIIVVLVMVSAFLISDYIRFLPNDWVEGDVSKWEERFPDNPAYEMALNCNGYPMFKDPLAALKQFKIDYEELLDRKAKEYNLPPLSKYNYWDYKIAEVPPGEEQYIIFLFCSCFANSISEDENIW